MAADVLHASRDEFPSGLSRSTELLVDELDGFESLLNDLLEISRLDSGVGELSVEMLDLRRIVRAAVDQTRVIAGESGSSVEFAEPDEEVTAEVDHRRTERVLRNLLGNAIDHSEGRPVRVLLAGNEQAVAVTVRDYGVGLHPDEAELVFNRFWRADVSRNRHTGGTGLGLAISHEDARLHGGRLEVWGNPGEGTCFRLTLPRRCHGEFEQSPLALPPDPPGQDGSSELVAPDSADGDESTAADTSTRSGDGFPVTGDASVDDSARPTTSSGDSGEPSSDTTSEE